MALAALQGCDQHCRLSRPWTLLPCLCSMGFYSIDVYWAVLLNSVQATGAADLPFLLPDQPVQGLLRRGACDLLHFPLHPSGQCPVSTRGLVIVVLLRVNITVLSRPLSSSSPFQRL